MSPDRRRFFVPLFMFLLTLGLILRSPAIHQIRAVDVVLIFASGMCLGVALVTLIRTRSART